MSEEISYDARLVLRQLEASVRSAIEDGIGHELVLDAVAAGLASSPVDRALGPTPLAMSLTRAFYSSVGPAMGGSGPTEELDTSAGLADAPPASRGPHAPGPAEAPWMRCPLFPGAIAAFERTVR